MQLHTNDMAYQKQKQYRLPGYDYAKSDEYFITICTKERQPFLGGISQGAMKLSRMGNIAKKFLLEIPGKFENVHLDEWIIIPINHVPIKNKSGIPNNPMELPYNTVGKLCAGIKMGKI